MKKFKKYLVAIILTAGFLFLFALTRIPTETIKVASIIGRTFKQTVIKKKPPNTESYDVITSASIRVPDYEKES